jgi:ABC-type phosphate transport system substrate-binding protein
MRTVCILIVLLTMAALVTASGPPVISGSQSNDLVIILNKSNPVDDISFANLRKIFLAEQKYWPNGRRVTVVMREPGQVERTAVLRQLYRMSNGDYARYFMHAEFTGEGQGVPKSLSSGAGVRKFVYNVPGAIGYLRASEVDGSVKVVRIDGRAPGEPGYRLTLTGQ